MFCHFISVEADMRGESWSQEDRGENLTPDAVGGGGGGLVLREDEPMGNWENCNHIQLINLVASERGVNQTLGSKRFRLVCSCNLPVQLDSCLVYMANVMTGLRVPSVLMASGSTLTIVLNGVRPVGI
ncbi:hypothetical protein F0562_012134 [Nyssa sinensis]|uniref:Uncharacterized protein n=1 Tax=Nyssa sinensis TaxID=561372 RepID=A0A5J4ZUC9_9ASTE|nr:hypothetical protein F0562_012134 [Nyssa sinensis]